MNDRKKEGGKQQSPETKKLVVRFQPWGEHDWKAHVTLLPEHHKVEGLGNMGITIYPGKAINDAQFLSADQLKQVIADIERQIDVRETANVPPQWRALLKELKYGWCR